MDRSYGSEDSCNHARNTALVENINEERGWLCKSGTNPSLFTVVPNDNEVVRPLVDVEDLVGKLITVHNNPAEASRRAENAYNWILTKMDWNTCIVPKWVSLFDKTYAELNEKKDQPVELVQGKVIEAESF